MNKHILAEVIGGGVILVLGAFIVYEKVSQHIEIVKTQERVEARQELQKNFDAKLSELQKQRAQNDAAFDAKVRALGKMSPAQVVLKAPEYVPNIPPSSRPIVLWQPGVTPPPSEGDAIVPADQIKPIGAQILAGSHCINDDLPNCQKQVIDWKGKYDLRDKDAKDWETVAKGGTIWHKLKKCGIIAGIGFGVGYAPNDPQNRMRNGAIGAGATGITCLFIH